MKCNNPITAILIGTHVDRWSKLDITRREISTLTTHCGKWMLRRQTNLPLCLCRSGDTCGYTIPKRCDVASHCCPSDETKVTRVSRCSYCRDVMCLGRCLQEQVACMTPEHALSEEEEVALIIRRQKLSKAWKAEEAIRTYFGISPESLPSRTALLESYS